MEAGTQVAAAAAGVSLVGNILQLLQNSGLREQNDALRRALQEWARAHDAWRAEALERHRRLIALKNAFAQVAERLGAAERERDALREEVAALKDRLAARPHEPTARGPA